MEEQQEDFVTRLTEACKDLTKEEVIQSWADNVQGKTDCCPSGSCCVCVGKVPVFC